MKLTIDALKERADAVASEELLSSISGGTENACHDDAGQYNAAEVEASATNAVIIRFLGWFGIEL